METIVTIASIPAILALVQLAKSFGVTGKWSTLLAVVLGVVLQVADYAALGGPNDMAGWYQAVAIGLILGLSAAGLYDAAKTASGPPAPDAGLVTVESVHYGTVLHGSEPVVVTSADLAALSVAEKV